MADVLINGFKMPESCGRCKLNYDTISCSALNGVDGYEYSWDDEFDFGDPGKRHPDCPLVELPPEKNRLYICDPSKADGCSKTGCAYTGGVEHGDCMLTTRLEWALMEVRP